MKLYQKVLLSAGAGAVVVKASFPWLEHDLKLIKFGSKMKRRQKAAANSLLIDKFEKLVEMQPKKTFLVFEGNNYSYEFVNQMACRVANIVKSWGLRPLDCVAMMIQNEPAFIWTYLGLQKLGVIAAFINHGLKCQSLTYCIRAAGCKYFIVGAGDSLLEAVIEVLEDLGPVSVFVQGLGTLPPPAGLHSFDTLMLTSLSTEIAPVFRKDINLLDVSCYIYTSGTTGYPKPSLITHLKVVCIGCVMEAVNLSESDVIYLVLPLYHTSGCIGFWGAVETGAKIVMRNKFSASQFWADCRQHDVTVIQYIGELFRYLVSQPPHTLDSTHKVRAAFGNGLRKDIWLEVNKRFKIPLIAEFFGATEGTSMTLNLSNKPGAIGRHSPLLRILSSDQILVKFDYTTAQPIRDKNGLCIKVSVGEPGLFVSKVPDNVIKDGKFAVYLSSPEANEQKLVRNVLRAGDLYFNYGDVMYYDKDYFLYFKDRIGDTFRWKGENVSTTEVANIISTLDFVQDANVYGVTIPGREGRAGMVALTLKDGCQLETGELKQLYHHICQELPAYARPFFVRLLGQAIETGTFKQRKVELVAEGYDPVEVKDPLYFLNDDKKTYTPLMVTDLSKFLTSKL